MINGEDRFAVQVARGHFIERLTEMRTSVWFILSIVDGWLRNVDNFFLPVLRPVYPQFVILGSATDRG